MFFKNSPGYCSRENKNNINCVGVLASTQPDLISDGKSEIKDRIAQIIRNNKYVRQLIGDRLGKKNDPLNYYEEMIFRYIYVNEPESLIHRHANRQVALEFMQTIRLLHDGLVNSQLVLSSFRRRSDDYFTLIRPINYENANKGNKLFVAKSVEINRSGEFTCPVESFMVFISEIYIDIESQEFEMYNDIQSSEDIDNLLLNDRNFPDAHELRQERLCEYRLFKYTRNSLKPLLWGKFIKKGGKKLEVKLRDLFSGAYLYMKLISPLNLMQEMGDMHDLTNIDVRYLGVKGIEIDV